jgi:hypothetical protein
MKIQNYKEFLNEAVKYSGDRSHSTFAVQSLSVRDQVHIWHWQTEVGDKHKALGDYYDDFIEQVDGLMEIIMGKYGRISVKGIGTPKPLIDLSDAKLEEYFSSKIEMYNSFRNDTFKKDPEIQNKIDEVVEGLEKLKYLLTMS